MSAIYLTRNYKWMPASNVKFEVEIDGQDKDQRIEARNNDTKIDIENENFKP